MKKYFYVNLLVILALSLPLFAQEQANPSLHYHGSEISLRTNESQFLVVFNEEVNKGFLTSFKADYNLEGITFSRFAEGEYCFNLKAGSDRDLRKKILDELLEDKRIRYAKNTFSIPEKTDLIAFNRKFLVKLKEGSEKLDLSEKLSLLGLFPVQNEFDEKLFTVSVNKVQSLFSLCKELSEWDFIAFAEPVYYQSIETSSVPTDPLYKHQWSSKETFISSDYWHSTALGGSGPSYTLETEDIWDITTGNSSIKIAVLGTGIDLNHQDLSHALLAGYDATLNGTNGDVTTYEKTYNTSSMAHETASAGVISSMHSNNKGTAGIAPNCKILPVKIFHQVYSSSAPPSVPWVTIINNNWIVDGINWSVSNGADILSNSWGLPTVSAAVDNSINSAVSSGRGGKGCLVVFATGNNDLNTIHYPAILSSTIAVGAINGCMERKSTNGSCGEIGWPYNTWGSNYGSGLDLMAPGIGVPTSDYSGNIGYSTGGSGPTGVDPDYMTNYRGTSSAAPHVSGMLGLLLSINPNMTGVQAREILESTCRKVSSSAYTYAPNSAKPNGDWNNEMGYGYPSSYEMFNKYLTIDYSYNALSEIDFDISAIHNITASNISWKFEGVTSVPGVFIISSYGTKTVELIINGVSFFKEINILPPGNKFECISEIDGESVFERRYEISEMECLKTMSTVVYDESVYSISQNCKTYLGPSNITFYEDGFVLSKRDLNGNVIDDVKYELSGDKIVSVKEMHIIPEGIFILGNITVNYGDLGPFNDNARASYDMRGVLIKIDLLSHNIVWSKEYDIPVGNMNYSPRPDRIFLNSFSEVKSEEGEFDGWIAVGSTRRYVPGNSGSYMRMNPLFLKLDANGNIVKYREILNDIACNTPGFECDGLQNESNFATHITEAVDDPHHTYAILLESRDAFHGILNHLIKDVRNGVMPYFKPENIRMSYVFIDKELEVNISSDNSIPPGTIKWWTSANGRNNPLMPRRILYTLDEIDGVVNQRVKIGGQYRHSGKYEVYDKGFIYQFDNVQVSSSPTAFSLYNLNYILSTDITNSVATKSIDGFVDILEDKGFTYALSKNLLIEIDMNGSPTITNATREFNNEIFVTNKDFGWKQHYTGNLINKHPDGGFLINDIQRQILIKSSSGLDLKCSNDEVAFIQTPLAVGEDYFEWKLANLELTVRDIDVWGEELMAEAICCDEDGYSERIVKNSETSENQTKISSSNEGETASLDKLTTSELSWSIYPNPTDSRFTIGNSTSMLSYESVVITNIDGKVINEFMDVASNKEYDLSGNGSGMYFVEIRTGDMVQRMKIILQN